MTRSLINKRVHEDWRETGMRLDGDWRNDDESGGADGESPTGRNKKENRLLSGFRTQLTQNYQNGKFLLEIKMK